MNELNKINDKINQDKTTIITKENLIKLISNNCSDDFISMSDLIKVIDRISDNEFISKKKLIKSVKDIHTKIVVKDVYNTFEHLIFQLLSSVDKNHDISIRAFEGINIDGTFIPEKKKKNNLTGNINMVSSRIKPKFTITRYYREKLNEKLS